VTPWRDWFRVSVVEGTPITSGAKHGAQVAEMLVCPPTGAARYDEWPEANQATTEDLLTCSDIPRSSNWPAS